MRGVWPLIFRSFGCCLLFCAWPAAAHPPYGLVADEAGNVYFSDLETVWRLAPDGRLTIFRPAVPETHVHELAMAPDGAIEGDQNRYDPATERFYVGIWRRSLGGEERAILPMTETPPRGIGVWQDRAGNRYTAQWRSNADRRMALLRRTPNGGVDMLFAEGKEAGLAPQRAASSVGGMAFAADGSLYFADRNLLRRLGPDGAVATLFDGGSDSSLRGIATAGRQVLAADMGAKTVLAISPDGKARIMYREAGPWLPTAVALARGRLLVLEANADPYDYVNRVRVVEAKEGRARVVALPGGPASAQPPAPGGGAGRGDAASIAGAALAALGVVALLWRRRAARTDRPSRASA